MDRIARGKIRLPERFGDVQSVTLYSDPELRDIMVRFIFGDVLDQGDLDDKTRELITLAVLTTSQTLPQVRPHTEAALKLGLTPIEIKEAIYQCAPYIGFPKVLSALDEVNAIFEERGIPQPTEGQSTTTEDTRFEKGLAVQRAIFGVEHIDSMRAGAPDELKHIQDYLSAFCFGDFYTRNGLDLKTRELLTLCIVSALGGCENQVKAHVQGNLNVGNDKNKLITAITHCLPYVGFPRTLNALAVIYENPIGKTDRGE